MCRQQIRFFSLFFLLPFFFFADFHNTAAAAAVIAPQINNHSSGLISAAGIDRRRRRHSLSRVFANFGIAHSPETYHCASKGADETVFADTPTDGGIKETIAGKFQKKYQKWKDELLSTEYGRRQWESYSNNKHFILIITVADKEGVGAGTGKYLWNQEGALVGATITLGHKLDKGLPNPIYFPVMNALSPEEASYMVSGDILAAAKFAHEFGHVNQTSKVKAEIFQLQNRLIPVYNEILLKNGYNTKDQKLIDLAAQMGGTPVEIWENREYWGEADAMLYLAGRITKESYHCAVYNKMKQNIRFYARDYEERFDQIAKENHFETACSKF